jgi:hypothetical protein
MGSTGKKDIEARMESTEKNDIDEQRNATRSSCRPKRPPTTRNEDFFVGNRCIKSKVVGHNVNSNTQTTCRQTCASEQLICTLNTYNVHDSDLQVPKKNECTSTNQRPRERKLNKQRAVKNTNKLDPFLTQTFEHN